MHQQGVPDGLFWRWVRWTLAGEVLGFVAPAVVGVLTANWASRTAFPLVVAAGAVEGLLLGGAQARALVPVLPGLRTGRFAAATALAAALAYALGMLPSTLGQGLAEAPSAVVVPAVVVGGTVLLGSIGTAQWFELRRHVDRGWTWIPNTALAWLAGLAVFLLVATPLWHPGQRPVVAILVGVVAAVGMAATVAIVTGAGLRRLLGAEAGSARQRSEVA